MNLHIESQISQKKVNLMYNKAKVGLILSGNTGENTQGIKKCMLFII